MAFFEAHGGREAREGEAVDIGLVNSCTVTGEAGRKTRQALRRLRREHPEAVLAVMGCCSELEDLSELVDLSTGTSGRLQLGEACLEFLEARRRGMMPPAFCPETDGEYEELGVLSKQSESRAQIKISDGCSMRCAYCAISRARGRVRSRSREQILEEAKALLANGHRELVLTATHLSSFELDKGRDSIALAELLESLDSLPGLLNLRLGSLEPASLTPAFIERISGLKTLVPHFHLALQSGSDAVLKRMARRYDTRCFREVVSRLREAFDEPFFSTDVMVGFPEETEAEFQESLNFVEEIGFSRLHVFRYSIRENTPAARRPQVPAEIAEERSLRMQALGRELSARAAASRVGKKAVLIVEETLPDSEKPWTFTATSRRYLPAWLRSETVQLQHGSAVLGTVEASEGERILVSAERLL